MALEDIIKEIEMEKDTKKEEIEREKEEDIMELKKRFEKEIEEKRNQVLKDAKEKYEKGILKEEKELERERKNLILREKRKILNEIAKTSLEEIRKIDEKTYKNLLSKLINQTSQETVEIPDSEIEIVSACGKENLLKDTLQRKQKNYLFSQSCLKSIGGFTLKTKKFDIDCTFESLFKKIWTEKEIELARMIFS